MISAHANNEDPQESATITPGGTHAVQTVSHVGRKIHIRRPTPDGEDEWLAEILSIRDKPVNSYASASVQRTNSRSGVKEEEEDAIDKPEDKWDLDHLDQFNKRLDEWVTESRLALSTGGFEWPPGEAPHPQPLLTPAPSSEWDLTDEEVEEVDEEMVKALQRMGSVIRNFNAYTNRVVRALQERTLHSVTHSVDPIPLRRQRAIAQLLTEGLQDNEVVAIIKHFTANISIADSYLAIYKDSIRRLFLQSYMD